MYFAPSALTSLSSFSSVFELGPFVRGRSCVCHRRRGCFDRFIANSSLQFTPYVCSVVVMRTQFCSSTVVAISGLNGALKRVYSVWDVKREPFYSMYHLFYFLHFPLSPPLMAAVCVYGVYDMCMKGWEIALGSCATCHAWLRCLGIGVTENMDFSFEIYVHL